jgi:prepilin-type N-terminal cleavage/methylation domain-containing protein/prepilin-type processing-associated H-X9-DG protein
VGLFDLKLEEFNIRNGATARSGFTLIELLTTLAIVAILIAMIFPALSVSKARASRIQCVNNLKQLSLSLMMYANESDDELPPRRGSRNWIKVLEPYYETRSVLRCPTELPALERTYILNAFNDWFEERLSILDFLDYMDWKWEHGIKVSDIHEPSASIAFGEKKSTSGHIHADLLQGVGNDLEEVDHQRHYGQGFRKGSNFAFVDGSVQFLPYWRSVSPVNLWAVTPRWRSAVPTEQ